jgi:hypothetical protein
MTFYDPALGAAAGNDPYTDRLSSGGGSGASSSSRIDA